MMDSPHLMRLMKLCRMLVVGDGMTVRQLRSKLKASRRTVFRDLKMLHQMGMPVQLKNHEYRIKLKLARCRKKLGEAQIRALNKLLDASLR